MQRIHLGSICLAIALIVSGPAFAANAKVRIGYTAVPDFSSLFVAQEQGLFKKHGIDAELIPIALNSTLPAALISESIEVGGVTPPVFLQAVSGGLQLTIVSGVSATTKELVFGAVAKKQDGSFQLSDLPGKKVGVPGIGATLHVMFVRWLQDQGIDPGSVTFVETPFPTQFDLLKAGTVDIVVTAQPNIDRIVDSGTGTLLVNLGAQFQGLPGAFWVSTSAWADAHPDLVKNYRDAIREAGVLIAAQPAEARANVAKYIKMPPELLKKVPLPNVTADVEARDLEWWIKVVTEQKLIESPIDAKSLIAR